MKGLSIFSWGFWYWGTSTSQLLAAVKVAEARRGFRPPIFVDVRYRRSGRAPGFKDGAFEALLGWRRYRWMPSLGNSNIGIRKGIRIACPPAADQLLDFARDAAERSTRVIFFCACESPWGWDCHRHEVARLVGRAAQRRGLAVHVQEWPGGEPSSRPLALHVSAETLRALAGGAKSVPLPYRRVPPAFASLPWGALVRVTAGGQQLPVSVGPAAFRSGRWVLPRFEDAKAEPTEDLQTLRRRAIKLRRRYLLN